jgi:hypothetical protein
MKKFVKVCLIIAACFMFLGIFFVGIGYAIGGANITTEFASGLKASVFKMDDVKIGYHVDTDFDKGNTDFGNWSNSSIKVYNGMIDQTEIAKKDDINKVVCKVAACNFEIKESPNDMYMIKSTTIGKFRCYQNNDILYFEGINDIKIATNITGKITLYIPKDVDLELFELHAAACDLDIDEIFADQVKIQIGAGDVNINKIFAQDVSCELGAGQIVIDFIEADTYIGEIGAGEIFIKEVIVDLVETEVGVGNAEFGLIKANTISVECAMGNIEVMIDGAEDEYSYSATCVAGNVSIGKHGGAIIGSVSNKLDVDKSISADCAMGNIKIRFLK